MMHGWYYNPYMGSYVPHWSLDEYPFVFHPILPMLTILKKSTGFYQLLVLRIKQVIIKAVYLFSVALYKKS